MSLQYVDLSHADLLTEWTQAKEEGRILTSVEAEFTSLLQSDLEVVSSQMQALNLLDKIQELPLQPEYRYHEPSDLTNIKAARPQPQIDLPTLTLSDSELLDRFYGAWVGRSSGCLLGKPIEGWRTKRLWPMLKETNQFPLSDYLRFDSIPDNIRTNYDVNTRPDWADCIDGMPDDDDLNYTTTGLAVFQKFGSNFTPDNVIEFWNENIPLLNTFTAERTALRNLGKGLKPPLTATTRNPYREWIGAQIRADFWGYVAAGNPELAAELAFRDASVSHVKNGIYGEMWAAAMVATAFVTQNPREIILAGMDQIPEKSRLYDYLESILEWHEIEVDYDTCVRRVHEMWDENTDHHWCHTIPNAMIVALGLLFGEGDFQTSICRAVQPCFDTDCNGATVGSIFGAAYGRKALPEKWVGLLNGRLHTGVAGYEDVSFADMAKSTLILHKL